MDKLFYERQLSAQGYARICGADEVGRGPLAGPVVCAAVIMPTDCVIEGVDDSKKLSAKKREALSEDFEKSRCIRNMPGRSAKDRRNKHFGSD